MTTPTLACDDELLRQSLEEQLSEQQEAALIQHLSECPACQRKLELLAADHLEWCRVADVLRREAASGASSVGTSGVLDSAGDSAADFAVDFLEPSTQPGGLGRLGGIEILEVIGHGGMGLVLKGFQPELHRPVAVKVLAPHLAASGAARQRFAREAQAAAVIVHPNVMPLLTVHSSGRLPYLVMPYVSCESLQQRLDRQGSLETLEVLRIALQVSRGLAAAHAQGLVHRDVKPANILLEKGVDRVLLTDFGLARAADDASLTRTGVIAGTPQYMSPEQACGESLDARSDLFSLGSVMYAMATGRPPFRAETSYGILRRITDTEPRPIRDVNPAVPDWLAAVIAKLHAKNLAERFASADELADLLEQCLAHVRQPDSVPLPAGVAAVAVCVPDATASPYADAARSMTAWRGRCASSLVPRGTSVTQSSSLKPSLRSLLVAGSAAAILVLAVIAGDNFQRHETFRHKPPLPSAQLESPEGSPTSARPTADQSDPHEQLGQRLSLDLQAVPLPQALAQLAEKMRTNIVLDEESIRQAGIPADAPVTIQVQAPERASAILKLMLQPRKLGYIIEGRSIKVTTWEVVESTQYVRVYPVADLLDASRPEERQAAEDQAGEPKSAELPPRSRYDFRSLISLITSTVEPPSWESVGGAGRIEAFEARTSLVITQTQPQHEAIDDLLNRLRRTHMERPDPPNPAQPQQRPKAGGGGPGGFFGTDAGLPRPVDIAVPVTKELQVREGPEHVCWLALGALADQEVPMRRLPALGHSCGGLWYLPDGKTLLSAFGCVRDEGGGAPDKDPRHGQIEFWDTATWISKATLNVGVNGCLARPRFDISSDGRLAAAVTGECIAVWDISSLPEATQPLWLRNKRGDDHDPERHFSSVAFSPDSARVASVELWQPQGNARAGQWGITVCDAVTGQPQHRVALRSSSSGLMQFAPDGNSLALMVMPARGKQALQFVDAATWKITRGVDWTDVIRLLGYPIHLMDHLPDGRFLAACADNSVLLLDIQTARFEILGRHPTRGVPGYFGTGTAIMAQTLSHDGRFLATGGHENLPTIRVWNLTTKRQVHKLQHPAGHYVSGLAFSPDGSQLASGVNWDEDGQGAVCLWDLSPRLEAEREYQK